MWQRFLDWILPGNVWRQQHPNELEPLPLPLLDAFAEMVMQSRAESDAFWQNTLSATPRSVACTCRPTYNPAVVADPFCFACRDPEPQPTHGSSATGPIRVEVRPRYKN